VVGEALNRADALPALEAGVIEFSGFLCVHKFSPDNKKAPMWVLIELGASPTGNRAAGVPRLKLKRLERTRYRLQIVWFSRFPDTRLAARSPVLPNTLTRSRFQNLPPITTR
jgi:hypothetical protein